MRERILERSVVRSIPMSEIFIVVTLRPEQLPFDIESFLAHFQADSEIPVNTVELRRTLVNAERNSEGKTYVINHIDEIDNHCEGQYLRP